MPAGKKGNANKAADQVLPEETKVNAAKGGKPQSKSPAPNKKGGKFESAPEPMLQVRGRTKQAQQDSPNPPVTAEKGKARAGTAVSAASKKSVAPKQPSKSPAAAKSTERSAKKPGKKASAAANKHVEPENSSDDELEESKVQPPVQAKGKNKKPLSKCIQTHHPVLDMTAEKRPKKAGAMSMTEEKPKSRFGKIVEKPEGLQPTRPLTGYIFFSNEEVPKFVTSQGCSYKEAIKQAGAKWGELTAEQKAPYQKKYEQDKLR